MPCCEGWNDWGTWGTCDDTCYDSVANPGFNPGVTTRTRTCGCGNNVLATDDFSNCIPLAGGVGQALESEDRNCPMPAKCPYWAEWGEWGSCSETCRKSRFNEITNQCEDISDSVKSRSRTCLFGDIGGPNCPEGGQNDSKPCDDNLPFCCSYSLWLEWEDCTAKDGLL